MNVPRYLLAMYFLYVHSLMSYKGFMYNNKSLLQIEDLGRSNSKYYIESIQTSLLSIQIDKYKTLTWTPFCNPLHRFVTIWKFDVSFRHPHSILFGMVVLPFICRDVGFLSFHRTVSLAINLLIFLFSFIIKQTK